jgi:hypothetical protein
MTSKAMLGYTNADAPAGSPFLATSNSDCTWRIGAANPRSAPRNVRPSRGVNEMKVPLNYIQGCVEIERIA